MPNFFWAVVLLAVIGHQNRLVNAVTCFKCWSGDLQAILQFQLLEPELYGGVGYNEHCAEENQMDVVEVSECPAGKCFARRLEDADNQPLTVRNCYAGPKWKRDRWRVKTPNYTIWDYGCASNNCNFPSVEWLKEGYADGTEGPNGS
ncbi:unnamed protein product, partial [Mesorhabditis spiculigera]